MKGLRRQSRRRMNLGQQNPFVLSSLRVEEREKDHVLVVVVINLRSTPVTPYRPPPLFDRLSGVDPYPCTVLPCSSVCRGWTRIQVLLLLDGPPKVWTQSLSDPKRSLVGSAGRGTKKGWGSETFTPLPSQWSTTTNTLRS